MKWFRKLMGTEDIYNQINDLQNYITGLRGEVARIHHQHEIHNRALGRIIAKLDPTYASSEFDPARKAASDAAGAEVINRIKGEMLYSDPLRGHR